MIFSVAILNYAIKKGINKEKIFYGYALLYLIVCVLLIVTIHFTIIGISAVALVYLIRLITLKKFLNRISIA